MSNRVIVTLHLPLEMGLVGRVLKVIGAEYPDATVSDGTQERSGAWHVYADDGNLSKAQRRAIAKARQAKP